MQKHAAKMDAKEVVWNTDLYGYAETFLYTHVKKKMWLPGVLGIAAKFLQKLIVHDCADDFA